MLVVCFTSPARPAALLTRTLCAVPTSLPQPQVLVYPGADEVGLTMLSRVSVDVVGKAPTARLVFRDPATIGLVPNYEGQPMIDTLKDQVKPSANQRRWPT